MSKTRTHAHARAAQRGAASHASTHGSAVAQAVQPAWVHHLHHSPRQVEQRHLLGAAFGPVAQRAPRDAGEALPVQRRIDVELLLATPERRQRLFDAGIGVDDLEEIQELLEDAPAVEAYLRELETAIQGHFKDHARSERKYTRALDMALWEQEKRWAVESKTPRSEPAKRELIPADSGQEGNERFLGRIRTAKPLKDVGAAVSHGEYAHRIQWYVITRSAQDIGSVSPAWLKRLYSVLGDAEFETQVDKYKAAILGNTWTLWNAVVDVPGSIAEDGRQPDSDKPTTNVGAVGFSAPVRLTTAISAGQGGLGYSQLRLAVLNRRLKRYFQLAPKDKVDDPDKGRPDLLLTNMLKALPDTMQSAGFKKDVQAKVLSLLEQSADWATPKHAPKDFSYDQRNVIAAALCGIAPFRSD